MMLRTIFSSGSPFFSYTAIRKNGSMTRTMQIDAPLALIFAALEQKEKRDADERTAAETDKLRFVRLNKTFVFTAFRSLGT
jgi:hypothetical protein